MGKMGKWENGKMGKWKPCNPRKFSGLEKMNISLPTRILSKNTISIMHRSNILNYAAYFCRKLREWNDRPTVF